MTSKPYPILPLRDIVIFPNMIAPLFVGRLKSINALETVMEENKEIVLLTQKKSSIEDPSAKDLFKMGTLGNILQMLKLPDGTVKVLVEGKFRCEIEEIIPTDSYLSAKVTVLNTDISIKNNYNDAINHLKNNFEKFAKLNNKVNSDILSTISDIEDPNVLSDTVVNHLIFSIEEKQSFLEMTDAIERVKTLASKIEKEIEILSSEKKIRRTVKQQMEKTQREYYLNEQLKAIQKELGTSEDGKNEFDEFEDKINKTKLSKEANEKALSELKKLRNMSPMSAEATVVRSYIDWLVSIPWKKTKKVKTDIVNARKILDDDHYGLEKVKDRIIEFLAVQKRTNEVKGPILCLVGPPGVGKTSLGKSIAEALGRKYERVSLGGLRDESEIRGHRKTYIGAMPGRIIKSIKKANSSNPVFVLDEIDKITRDAHGDPSSAMLEVLDPEQNSSFHDNYLEIGYDLSKVMFVATANSLVNIQPALLDRMEIIEINGYTLEEKIQIAKKHLLPKQLKEHGLNSSHLKISNKIFETVIDSYTRESGVRGLDKMIAKLVRYAAKSIAMNENYNNQLSHDDLKEILGIPLFDKNQYLNNNMCGVVTGLAWTSVGGDILFIESSKSPGKGKLSITGNLGNVMKESSTIAMQFIKSNSKKLGIKSDDLITNDVHIHVPEGATPKDGPSAGITMLTALVSLFSGRKVKSKLAMTGEITLRGKVLPVGGIKEKILAAKRAGIKEIILCEQNKKDVDEINLRYLKGLKFHYINKMKEVIDISLI